LFQVPLSRASPARPLQVSFEAIDRGAQLIDQPGFPKQEDDARDKEQRMEDGEGKRSGPVPRAILGPGARFLLAGS
jgi:hypothetical protein